MNTSKRLEGRVALITGGTSGIGKATVELFCLQGAKVAFTGRRAELGQRLATDLNDRGNQTVFIQADHTNPQDCHSAVDQTIDAFGQLDILFNNAGIVPAGTAEETSEEIWQQTMALNITAVWRMSKFALPHLRAGGKGVIVNNASDWGVVAGKQAVAYCTSKGAVIQLTKAMALDHAEEGIRINAVCPGDTYVERWEQDGYFLGSSPADRDEINASGAYLPIGRVARAEEIANAVLFLACDESSYVTGTALLVDGGNTAR